MGQVRGAIELTAPADAAASTTVNVDPSKVRRRRLLRLAATFVVLFAVCLATVLPGGRATPLDYAGVPANARTNTLIPKLGIEDAGHYIRAGYNIAKERGLPLHPEPYAVSDRFILSFWPPGMPFYYAVLFTVFGPDMPVGVVAGATMALLWALLLTAYADLLARMLHWMAAVAMVGLVLVSDVMRAWILGPGVFWSEGLYTWCILAALYAATRSAATRSPRTRLAWAGAHRPEVLVSCVRRNISDLLGWIMIVVLVGWAAGSGVRAVAHRWQEHRGSTPSPSRRTWHQQLLGSWCAWWRSKSSPCRGGSTPPRTSGRVTTGGRPSRATSGTTRGRRPGARRSDLRWLSPEAQHRMPSRRSTCRKIATYELRQPQPYSGAGRYTEAEYRRLAIRALARHPAEYAIDRLRYLRTAWFWKASGSQQTELVENGLLAAAVVGALALSVRRVRKSGPDLVALLFPGLVVISLLPLVFIHFGALLPHGEARRARGRVRVVALDPLRVPSWLTNRQHPNGSSVSAPP
jgi:hypothetical protein